MSVFVFLATLLVVFLVGTLYNSLRRPKNYPPGPPFMPWTGNSIQLRKLAKALGGQYKVFEQWVQRYQSPLLGLKLGSELVVVAYSYELVRDVHLLEAFEGRPDSFFLRLRTMGTRKGITCTDGQLWYEHRNFAMKQMRHVGYGRSQMERHIVKECESLLEFIRATGGQPVWPGSFLAPSVINVLWSLAAGKRFERDDKRLTRLLEMLNRRSKVFDMSGGVLSQFPWLRFLAPNRTGYNLICQLNQELAGFFVETIDAHKATMTPAMANSDLIYAYIHEMDKRQETKTVPPGGADTFNVTQLTMTILDFFIAGSQTTSTTIDLCLMMLALREDVQDKVYAEVASNAGVGVEVLGARDSYPFTEALIMEVQRFHLITPITGPRRALWDTSLGGYSIPRNTTVLIGLHAVMHDKKHWGDPEVFRPERFIDREGKNVRDEYFMPFGQGRRRCLGDALARACIFTFLVHIVQQFRIVASASDPPSMVLQPGLTHSPKPYKIQFVARE